MPLIEVHQTGSLGEIPSIDITFSNGMKDSMVLERFFPTKKSRMERKSSCNYFGHLKNEKSASVSVTGCWGRDDLAITINSIHSGPSNMYIIHKNGDLQMVKNNIKVCTTFIMS